MLRLASALFCLAAAAGSWKSKCDLPEVVDPDNECVLTDDATIAGVKWGSLDVDEVSYDGDQPIKLSMQKIEKAADGQALAYAYKDHNRYEHSPTDGTLTPDTTNGRYLLTCSQPTNSADAIAAALAEDPPRKIPAEEKTLRITVTRPTNFADGTKAYTYFGSEFLQMYRRDEWTPLRSETEPYSLNAYGSKVPLTTTQFSFRPGEGGLDANGHQTDDFSLVVSNEFNVFMAVPNDGDFVFRYANPNLKLGEDNTTVCDGTENGAYVAGCGTWTAIEFSKTFLRVGSPYAADCNKETKATVAPGALFPAYLGHPNLKKHIYEDFAEKIKPDAGVAAETIVVLDMFSPGAGNAREVCVKDGVTPMEECDGCMWNQATEACDGSSCVGCGKPPVPDTYTPWEANADKWTSSVVPKTADADAVYAEMISTRRLKAEETSPFPRRLSGAHGSLPYSKCYKAGAPCANGNSVCKAEYCNAERWATIQGAMTDDKITILGFIETAVDASTPRSKEAVARDIADHWLYEGTKVDGFYFNRVNLGSAHNTAMLELAEAMKKKGKFIVFGVGQFIDDANIITDKTTVGGTEKFTVDVAVALSATKAEVEQWNPFAWYPDIEPTRFGALITDCDADGDLQKYTDLTHDRGYGYTGITEKADFTTVSPSMTTAVQKVAAFQLRLRRLSLKKDRALTAQVVTDEYNWACDATRFYCRPVCMRTTGYTTTIVADSKCSAAAKLDECSCNCYHNVHWDCNGNNVVCVATDNSLVEKQVGDLACSSRGTAKPSFDECTRTKVQQQREPSSTCRAQYEQAKEARENPAPVSTQAPASASDPVTTTAPVQPALSDIAGYSFDIDSAALPLALAPLFAALMA